MTSTTATTTAGATPNGGRLGLLAVHAWTELRSSLRSVEFAIGTGAIPVLLYAMFGLPSAAAELPGGSRIGLAMLVSLSSYGIISLAIFTFGEAIAKERGRGWIRTLRATPIPVGLHLLGKGVVAVVNATLIIAAMGLLAATAGVRLEATGWLAFAGTMVAGTLVFSTLGFAIAYLAKPRAATVVANLIFLPLAFASGFFFPLSQLPDVVGRIAPWLPTFHFGQLAYRAVMPDGDVEAFTGVPTGSVWLHLAWVAGSAIVLGGLAVLAARREAVTRRG